MYLVTVGGIGDHAVPAVIIDSTPHTISLVRITNLTPMISASEPEPTRLGMHFNYNRLIIGCSLKSPPTLPALSSFHFF